MTSLDFCSPTTDWAVGLALAVAVSSIIALVHHAQSRAKRDFWTSLPWMDVRNEWRSKFKAGVRAVTGMQETIQKGHDQYSTQNKAYVQPMLNNDPWVVLPPSTLKDLVSVPESKISNLTVAEEEMQPWYTLPSPVSHDVLKFELVRKHLTTKLPLIIPQIMVELENGVERHWGTNTKEFVTINVSDTVTTIITQAANRALTGPELCRNDEFLFHMQKALNGVFDGSVLINSYPAFMRPIVGRAVTWWNSNHMKVCAAFLEPVVEARVRNIARCNEDPDFKWTAPNDALQWSIDAAIQRNKPEDLRPMVMAARILALNLVAIHTTANATSNVLLDLFSDPKMHEYIDALREESNTALEASGGEWNKQVLGELHKTDSTIRESMRCSDRKALSIERLITSDEPVDIGHGIKIPKGVHVAIPSKAIHLDESNYPQAHEFQPFRFVRNEEDGTSKQKNLSITTADDKFLYFGHGRHVCPGRFFASQEIKMFLTCVLRNYEVEPLSEKPKDIFHNAFINTDPSVTLRVRRRSTTTG